MSTMKRLETSKADEDAHEKVEERQNIVKCFHRPEDDEQQRASYTCTQKVLS